MPVLLSIDGTLVAPTTEHPGGDYKPVAFGKPLGVQLLTFFPGAAISEWGNRAELMLTSRIRVGPANQPAPRLIVMMLKGYPFKKAEPVTDYGGDVYGDRMLHYTKAYAGQELAVTLRGVELDKVGPKTWEGITSTITSLGKLALFTSAAPYLAAAGLATKMAKTLISAINRNDRLIVQRTDFFFDEPNQTILQAGRYLFWRGGPSSQAMKSQFRLSSKGDDKTNLLVDKKLGARYNQTPYIVTQIDGKERKEYEDFEIGAGSAELLEKWGDKDAGATIFQTIKELATQVNDARQLHEVRDLVKELEDAESEEEKAKIKEKMKARAELFSETNGDLLKQLLKEYLE